MGLKKQLRIIQEQKAKEEKQQKLNDELDYIWHKRYMESVGFKMRSNFAKMRRMVYFGMWHHPDPPGWGDIREEQVFMVVNFFPRMHWYEYNHEENRWVLYYKSKDQDNANWNCFSEIYETEREAIRVDRELLSEQES